MDGTVRRDQDHASMNSHPTASDELRARVRNLAATKGKVEAIKYVREELHLELRPAFEVVQEMAAGIQEPKQRFAQKIADWFRLSLVLLPAALVLFWMVSCEWDKAMHPHRSSSSFAQAPVDPTYGPKPVPVFFGDCPLAVDRWLKKTLTDPDSLVYETVSSVNKGSVLQMKGWVVTVAYRARNGFGGYVREIRQFVVRDERVLAQIRLDGGEDE